MFKFPGVKQRQRLPGKLLGSSGLMMVRQKARPLHGWFVLDKPLGLSSTQALGKVRWLFNAEKSGHGGTLDPLASGLLPIAFGEATKTIQWAMDGTKTYQFTVQWGSETSTDDMEGDIVSTSNYFSIDSKNNILPRSMDNAAMQHELAVVLPQYLGAVQQQPPAYSAIKVDGKRAYDLARAGDEVQLAPRTVQIDSVKILDWPTPSQTTFEVTCGKGTYVRSLARDLGRATGWLGHVVMLRRLRVGPFGPEHMISLEKLTELCQSPGSENSLIGLLRPIETVLDGIPALAVMDAEAKRLQQGQRVPLKTGVLLPGGEALREAEAVLVTHAGRPLGMFRIDNGVLKPIRLFNLDARSKTNDDHA
jgi:tRNA pseudouridine55 synthase